jgi:hypothetical protein
LVRLLRVVPTRIARRKSQRADQPGRMAGSGLEPGRMAGSGLELGGAGFEDREMGEGEGDHAGDEEFAGG